MIDKSILLICFGTKPPGWRLVETRQDGRAWANTKKKLTVIASESTELDGKRWLHLSIGHPKRLPSYDEMKYLKRHWAGTEAKAIEVHAPESEHVNIHSFVRHLWVCLEGDPLPDFTRGNKSI